MKKIEIWWFVDLCLDLRLCTSLFNHEHYKTTQRSSLDDLGLQSCLKSRTTSYFPNIEKFSKVVREHSRIEITNYTHNAVQSYMIAIGSFAKKWCCFIQLLKKLLKLTDPTPNVSEVANYACYLCSY